MRCFQSEVAPSALRALRRLPAMLACLACLAVLTGCRFGGSVSFFDEDNAIERAVASLKARIGAPVRVLELTIGPDHVTIGAQDPANRNRIDQWRLERMNVAWINWDRTSGPSPYEVTLVNPDLEANLFDLDEVDFDASIKLARAAIERAGLAGKSRVTRMEIARQIYILPKPSSGEIRWTIDVSSGRESVQVFADARGAIVGMNVSGTDRAKNLDILRDLNLVADAAQAFRYILGTDAILTAVSINSSSIGFETNVIDPSPPIPVSGSLSASRAYTWNLNGLQRAISRINADAAFGATRNVFSVDDADWKLLPKIAAAAAGQLSMPQGRVTGIEISKPVNPIGQPIVLWKIEVTDQNKEKGYILADTAGTLKKVMLPESWRTATDWYDPATMAATFARLGVDFGQDRQYAEITIFNDKVIITAQDHMQENISREIILSDGGYDRSGSPSMLAAKNVPFRIGDLSALTTERIRDLEARTLATLKMPPKTISSITIGRGGMDPSPKGNVTIEIRAEERPFGRAGRVNYELDGTAIKTYLP
jgi:hypothetical protein